MEELPKELEICFTAHRIESRVAALALEVSTWIERAEVETGREVLAVCILRGAVFFFSDLLRAIPNSVELGFCRTWGYSDDAARAADVRVWISDIAVSGRAVLLVDEICDTGATLKKLHDLLLEQGAAAVRSAVTVCRQIAEPKHVPDWVAFYYPGSEWLVGYGMDMENRFRNLSAIYRLVK